MKKINSQSDLDKLLEIPNWEEAFIREGYFLSPSYVLPSDKSTVAPDSPPILKVMVCTPEITCPGVELFFEEVEGFAIFFRIDLDPVGTFRNDYISFTFHGKNVHEIRAKSLYYRFLNKECWGWKLSYGTENFFDEAGFLNLAT